MADPTQLAALFRECAAGRREYLHGLDNPMGEAAATLAAEARILDAVAQVIDGDLGPLYNWLPSWRWTPEMTEALREESR